MVTIRWTEKSEKNLQDIHDYIGKDSTFYAREFIKNLIKKTLSLKSSPKLGRIVPEFNQENLREIIYKNYRIVYKIISSEYIDIISVSHGSYPIVRDSKGTVDHPDNSFDPQRFK